MPFTYPSGRRNARYEITGETRNGRDLYRVIDGFSYTCVFNGGPQAIGVPAGFETDLASIPSLPFMPNPGGSLWDDAAIVHDVAIGWARSGAVSYAWADAIFYHALLDRGCNRFTAWVFWAAVRLRSLMR